MVATGTKSTKKRKFKRSPTNLKVYASKILKESALDSSSESKAQLSAMMFFILTKMIKRAELALQYKGGRTVKICTMKGASALAFHTRIRDITDCAATKAIALAAAAA
tara:strand:- start:127 stop:450 length:324 start_codon:yes stop_codon:yes gene_type:complete